MDETKIIAAILASGLVQKQTSPMIGSATPTAADVVRLYQAVLAELQKAGAGQQGP
jgi:hypothetical protein